VASTPIELSEVSGLIGVLAEALGEAIDTSIPADAERPRPTLIGVIRNLIRPKLAQVTELRLVKNPRDDSPRG
jgi:hypothetical protein